MALDNVGEGSTVFLEQQLSGVLGNLRAQRMTPRVFSRPQSMGIDLNTVINIRTGCQGLDYQATPKPAV